MDGLRPYQIDAADAVDAQFAKVRATMIVMCTGGGKTRIFAEVLRRRRSIGRGLVIAHRQELLDQAAEAITRWTGLTVGIEAAERGIEPLFMPDVVIASVQTLTQPKRREKFAPEAFHTVVIDECHHAPSESYGGIINRFRVPLLGVTATPDRLDRKAMGRVFESVAFTYSIRDAIKGQYLVPIRQQRVFVESLDLSNVRTVAGDLDAGELEAALTAEKVLHEMAIPIVERAGKRPTIVFTAGVAQAHALAEVISRYAGAGQALALDGTSSKDVRREGLAAYKAGSVRFLVNCGLFTEGFDAPETACIAVARPTKSRALYVQMAGRGLRIAQGKTDCIVLDFVGNSGRHKLVTTLDVLDGTYSDEVQARAQALMEEGVDVVTALDDAEAAIAAEKRAQILLRARYRTEDIDPFSVLGVSDRESDVAEALSERQAEVLVRNGIAVAGMDRRQASRLIDAIVQRSKADLCTFKMARQLARFGLRPDVSFADAKRALDAIAATRWKGAPAFIAEDPAFKVEVQ